MCVFSPRFPLVQEHWEDQNTDAAKKQIRQKTETGVQESQNKEKATDRFLTSKLCFSDLVTPELLNS
jgi:hypothetical protein